jgi:hypothetical protein
MKILQWKKVTEAKLQTTIWGQSEFQSPNSLLSVTDYKLLEDLFGENAVVTPRRAQVENRLLDLRVRRE